MNCSNCGAPMVWIEGRGHFRCDFCATFHFPQPLEDSADRVSPLQAKTETPCPTCREPLQRGAMDGVSVRYCDRCRGILLESSMFAEIVRNRRAAYKGAEPKPVPINPEEFKRKIECPECTRTMEVHPYYGPGNAVIDSCARCRLVWLDHGEMSAIERASGRR